MKKIRYAFVLLVLLAVVRQFTPLSSTIRLVLDQAIWVVVIYLAVVGIRYLVLSYKQK